MKQEDEEPTQEPTQEPTEDELREAAALAEALERDAPAEKEGAHPPPVDALETAALLRHAHAPLSVPPAHEPIATAMAATTLDARRTRTQTRRRAARWLVATLAIPSVAAAWILFDPTFYIGRPTPTAALPTPSADLLAAQAQATRGGSGASAALARLDAEMRTYRRQYHAGLRRRGGGAP